MAHCLRLVLQDAGATSVEVRLKDYGETLLEVIDNGSGVSPENYVGLTRKYHTSKISEFDDIWAVASFGFRGEALSSLCELAGSFQVTTRTRDESVGTKISYQQDGSIASRSGVARAVGTTVEVGNLFLVRLAACLRQDHFR